MRKVLPSLTLCDFFRRCKIFRPLRGFKTYDSNRSLLRGPRLQTLSGVFFLGLGKLSSLHGIVFLFPVLSLVRSKLASYRIVFLLLKVSWTSCLL